jgi:putative two-component system response regulator
MRPNMDNPLKNSNILVVDDTPANLTLLANMLKEKGCKIRPVPNGKLALKIVENEAPDLILLDINMPDMSGYEVCRRLKADRRFSEIPVIFISSLTETLDKVEAFTSGGVDYITKPFQFEEVEARLRTHINLRRSQIFLEELVKEKVKEISDSQMSTIFALSKLAESRSTDMEKHLERVQKYCRALAERLSLESPYKTTIDGEFICNISNASPLHDIGKVAISDAILLKPGRLTPEEFDTMKTHTLIGAKTLEDVKNLYPGNEFINMGISIARSHHERWDGNGYPDHLAGEAIPLAARIMAVADVYDALRSRRCYKEPLARPQCKEIIRTGSGTQFDPILVEAFIFLEADFDRIGCELGLDCRSS